MEVVKFILNIYFLSYMLWSVNVLYVYVEMKYYLIFFYFKNIYIIVIGKCVNL